MNNTTPTDTTPVINEILDLERKAVKRWCLGDPLGWVEISDEDILFINPHLTKPVLGKEEYRAYMTMFEKEKRLVFSDFINPKVVVVEDAAILTYNCGLSDGSSEGETSPGTWNVTEVYFRRHDTWKVVHSHWSTVNHRPPEYVEVPFPIETAPGPFKGVLGEVMLLESAAMERWRKGDPWGFVEIYAPNVTYFDTGTKQRLDGREVLSAEYALRAGKIFYDVMDFVDPKVRACGDTTVLAYRFLSTWLHPDGSVARRIPWYCSEVFVRSDGSWKINHSHWSFIKGERILS